MRPFRIMAGRVYVLAQARQHAPNRPDVLLALARAAEDAGFYGDSVVAYDEYLQISPKDDSVSARPCSRAWLTPARGWRRVSAN